MAKPTQRPVKKKQRPPPGNRMATKSLDEEPVETTKRTKVLLTKDVVRRAKTPKQAVSLFLNNVNKTTTRARRFKNLYLTVVEDLGGEELLSEGQKQTVKALCGLFTLREFMEVDMLNETDGFDLNMYTAVINAQDRALRLVGVKRVLKDASAFRGANQLNAYLKEKATDADFTEEDSDAEYDTE